MFAVDFIFPLGDSRIFKSRLSMADSSVDGKLFSEINLQHVIFNLSYLNIRMIYCDNLCAFVHSPPSLISVYVLNSITHHSEYGRNYEDTSESSKNYKRLLNLISVIKAKRAKNRYGKKQLLFFVLNIIGFTYFKRVGREDIF